MRVAFDSLVVIGAGKMGGALVEGWLAAGLKPSSITLVDPALAQGAEPWADKGVASATSPSALGAIKPALVLLAIKPQMMDAVLPDLAHLDHDDLTVLSIAAGTTLATLNSAFPLAKCVRSIPNTPAAVGAGVTGVYGDGLSQTVRDGITDLLSTLGNVIWVDKERDIDAVTAVSGSGPAYVFNMVEALEQASLALGLSPQVSTELARQTVVGAGALLDQSDESASQLRTNVTSPGGTTAAGLAVLRDNGRLEALMVETTRAAFDRSLALSASKGDDGA